MSIHIIDSNSESDEEMSNTSPDIADGNCNNCPVTINYVNKYIIVLQIVNFWFCYTTPIKIVNMYVLINLSI
jgi:hypothetical protein